MTYEHPLFTRDRAACHTAIQKIQGARRVWFCGAWCGWGFHEDGVRSGLRVAAGLGCDVHVLETPYAP
jgi:predicted NAD/FAD-binding protein